jgi:hypothetical protein
LGDLAALGAVRAGVSVVVPGGIMLKGFARSWVSIVLHLRQVFDEPIGLAVVAHERVVMNRETIGFLEMCILNRI